MNALGKKRVLVCPLGWGLGHASRDIPIVEFLRNNGHEVIVAGDELQLTLIAQRFEGIKTIVFPSFKVQFSKRQSQIIPILWIALRLPYHIIKEHRSLKGIVRKHRIDVVISDNRFGLWCKGVKSIFITHQLQVIFPKPFRFLKPMGTIAIRFLTNKYDYCLVPDFKYDDNLSGKLSHLDNAPNKVKFIGALSRFNDFKFEVRSPVWDLVGIASGPSPQREIFIDLIGSIGKQHNLKTLIIKGNPAEGVNVFVDNEIHYVGHLNDKEFANAIISSKYLITRAGYSTIMDLATLGVSGLIVPTPGQTEQEYLANYLSSKNLFRTCKQGDLQKVDLSLAQLIKKQIISSSELLEKTLHRLEL